LAQYIKQNYRLPDIPSEKEVLENGLDLGDMQIPLCTAHKILAIKYL